MNITIEELADKIAEEIGERYIYNRKVRDGDTLGGKLSMAEIIAKKLHEVFDNE